jgi:ADP-glucose pyrophosphorylase
MQTMNVVAYPFYGYWEDIGTVKSFFEENLKLTRHVSLVCVFVCVRVVCERVCASVSFHQRCHVL